MGTGATGEAQTQEMVLTGRVLGRCRLEERLGQGRTSVVYRARHLALDTTVAVKILTHEAAHLKQVRESFAREARALAAIDHENVLKVYDVGLEGELHFIVMELLEGQSVQDLITGEERVGVLDALRITRQAAAGLAAAHARGIIHRDVKPGNLVIMPDGTVKVVDFGLAAAWDDATKRVGTPHYMAPEVCRTGRAELGSDVYALGITLYHMLVGQPPYSGMEVRDVLRAHIRAKTLHPEREVPSLTPAVVGLLQAMTKGDPLVRPSAEEVVVEVDRFGGARMREKLNLRRLRFADRTEGEGTARRWVIGAVVVAAVAVVAFLGLRGGEGESNPEPEPRAETPPAPPTPARDPAVVAAERAEEERRENEARDLLEGAERWARENWHSRSDTAAVLSRYRSVRSTGRGTEAGEQAAAVIRQIEDGARHPHPDRTWSDPEALTAASEALETVRQAMPAALAARDYASLVAALPEPVSDPSGELEAEVESVRRLATALARLKEDLVGRLGGLPREDRRIRLDGETARVQALSADTFTIEQESETREVAWSDVPASEIASLALRAFPGDREALVALIAFSRVHDLASVRGTAELELGLLGGPRDDEAFLRWLESR